MRGQTFSGEWWLLRASISFTAGDVRDVRDVRDWVLGACGIGWELQLVVVLVRSVLQLPGRSGVFFGRLWGSLGSLAGWLFPGFCWFSKD